MHAEEEITLGILLALYGVRGVVDKIVSLTQGRADDSEGALAEIFKHDASKLRTVAPFLWHSGIQNIV
jgi:hypothetical protein